MSGEPASGGGAATDAVVLVLNSGSSSIKFATFPAGPLPLPRAPLWSGKVGGIGGPTPGYEESGSALERIQLDDEHPRTAALQLIRERVERRLQGRPVRAVAHRVVHGGGRYHRPTRVTPEVLTALRRYIPLAPLHQPFPLKAMGLLLAEHPELPQVACFDTAFHHDLPEVERALPLPHARQGHELRRYGFHGLSYACMARVLPERHGELARGRVIVAHLGSGASLCAMRAGRSVATTMGFSALEGLMMGTRTGSIDPGVLLYLMEMEGLSPAQVGHMLYHDSGLLGVSGISAEPRVLVRHEHDPGPQGARARLALQLFVRRIVREVGALTAVLGGLDLLVFTAGIGEHNAFIRTRVCRDLAWLGMALDEAANAIHAPVISTLDSRVRVAVEPTSEEWIAASDALALLGPS